MKTGQFTHVTGDTVLRIDRAADGSARLTMADPNQRTRITLPMDDVNEVVGFLLGGPLDPLTPDHQDLAAPETVCPTCQGTREVVGLLAGYRARCPDCRG